MTIRPTRMARLATLTVLAVLLGVGSAAAAPPSPESQAGAILDATDVRGGFIVHLGAGDGRLTAALRAGDATVVQGLEADADKVEQARAFLLEKGFSGPVSVDHWTAAALPYADDLVNLLVAEDLGKVPMDEVLRVLAPGGVAQVAGKKTVKPWPDEIDDWTHFLHDASNNAVAKDRRVGPPKRLRWWSEPRWCRSHEYISSFAAMVSGGGRIFYVFDEGLTGVTDPRLPERWTLVARDAFNGVLLWKRPLPDWRATVKWGGSLRGRPPAVPRRLVADGKHLYMTLSRLGPVEVIDPATGKTLRALDGTANAEELALIGGTLFVYLAGSGQKGNQPAETIVAVDADTGKTLWQADAGRYTGQSLAAAGRRAIFHNGKETVCVALADGKEHWRAESKAGRNKTFILLDDAVVECDGGTIVVRDADTGKQRWLAKTGGGAMRGQDLFVAGGRVWHAAGGDVVGYDLATGKPTKTIDPSSVQTPGHHLRCYRAKATERYLITQWRGVEFISLEGQPHAQADWTRGACTYGVMPGNGLLYVPPHPCFCYPGAKLTGFNALAAAGEEGRDAVAGPRLVKGPAYGHVEKQESEISDSTAPISEAWPTYRHDARRTGAAARDVPPKVETQWQVALGGNLTPPVLADGRVLVADKDTHTLYAVGAKNGKSLWHVTAGGRIDSPPTLVGGLAIFGCVDGHVYALRADDGVLAWRFRAAPTDRRILSDSRVESVWPVHGSVLVENGLVYCTAGRSTFLDGGIYLFALDPATGEVRHEARVDTWSPIRDDATGKPVVPAYYMEGARSDILVAQGESIYLGQYKFDRRLVRQDVPYLLPGADEAPDVIRVKGKPYTAPDENPKADYEKHQRDWLERTQKGFVAGLQQEFGGWTIGYRQMGLHLLAPFGFLDDSWFNRTYWMYAETWPGYYLTQRAAKTGQLLSVGPETTYAVQAYPSRNLQSPLFTPGDKGYLLFADHNASEPVLDPRTVGTTKGWGFTRTVPPIWYEWTPVRIRAMVLAGEHLFVAGPPDVVPQDDPMAAFEGRCGGVLRTVSAEKGETLAEAKLDAPPVFDGLIAVGGRLYMATTDGRLVCFAATKRE